nr:polypyrimidine tract-binding protein homolog 3 isoform X1 [Tanacetum cinerariifolium]
MPTTLEESFSLALIAEACSEDERPTIAIAKPNDLTARVHVQDPKQTTHGRRDEPNRILLVTIHRMLYPIAVEVLYQVFSPHGYVEKVVIFQKSAGFQALIQFQSFQNDIAARNSLKRRPVTPTEEVADSGHSSTLSSLVKHESPETIILFNRMRGGEGRGMRLQAMVTGRPYQGFEGSPEEGTWEWMPDSQSTYSSYYLEGKVNLRSEEYYAPGQRMSKEGKW